MLSALASSVHPHPHVTWWNYPLLSLTSTHLSLE